MTIGMDLGDKTSRNCVLNEHGEVLAARGGKNARKRTIVAVARKLGIFADRLWVTAEVYGPLRHSRW